MGGDEGIAGADHPTERVQGLTKEITTMILGTRDRGVVRLPGHLRQGRQGRGGRGKGRAEGEAEGKVEEVRLILLSLGHGSWRTG